MIWAAVPTCDNPTVENPVEPTETEIRAWALDADSLEPMQDWHLIIWGAVDPGLLVELASDPDSPKGPYFLWCLYGRVGDEVRTGRFDGGTWDVVSRSVASDDPAVSRWAARSMTLRSRPELFDYEDWCGGELARRADPWPPSERDDGPLWVEAICRIAKSWRSGGLSVREHFQRAAPDMGDKTHFVAVVRRYLRSQPELAHAWQDYVNDKRGTPSPYIDLRTNEVGWMNTQGQREDVSRYQDAIDATAQFIWREANWVLLRQQV